MTLDMLQVFRITVFSAPQKIEALIYASPCQLRSIPSSASFDALRIEPLFPPGEPHARV
jgi:hypothetical protein